MLVAVRGVRVAILVDALLDTVDPAVAQRFVDRFLVGEPALAGRLLVEPDPQLPRARTVAREPLAKVRG
jgi:hypothetical protein